MALSEGGFGRGRRWAGVAEGLLTCVAVFVVVGALVYATSRPSVRRRFDLTETAAYTLTEQTRQLLAALPQPIQVDAVLSPDAQAYAPGLIDVQREAIEYVRNLLREYELASAGEFRVRHLERYGRDAEKVEELRRSEGLVRNNVVLLRAGERTRQVFLEDLVTISQGFGQGQQLRLPELLALHGEGPLTSAILGVMDEQAPVLGVLSGYGRVDLFDRDPEGLGLGLLADAAASQGFEVREVDVSDGSEVPEDVRVMAVLGPGRSLTVGALRALEAYAERGGALLLAPDPTVPDAGLDELLAARGLRREQGVVLVRPGEQDGQFRMIQSVTDFNPEHPITQAVARQDYFGLFVFCAGLARHPNAAADLVMTPLVTAVPDSFGDIVDLSNGLQPGDYELDAAAGEYASARILAVAVEQPQRLVLVSGSSFLGNLYLGPKGGPANMDLALGMLNWLAQREAAIEARPRDVLQSRVDLTPAERVQVNLYVLVYLPLAGALLGVLVWWSRRR